MMTISVFRSRWNIFCYCAQMLLNLSNFRLTFAWSLFWLFLSGLIVIQVSVVAYQWNRWCLFSK